MLKEISILENPTLEDTSLQGLHIPVPKNEELEKGDIISQNSYLSQPSFCRGPPTHPGNYCKAYFESWTYDSAKGQCVLFIYGGCHATKNLFESKEDCYGTCNKKL